jgi:hypothetical protein
VAPDEAFQKTVGVVVEIDVPGALPLPGETIVGGGGTLAVLTVKYRVLETPLSPAPFDAVMFQRY